MREMEEESRERELTRRLVGDFEDFFSLFFFLFFFNGKLARALGRVREKEETPSGPCHGESNGLNGRNGRGKSRESRGEHRNSGRRGEFNIG